jgi:Tol biopolymer transport system component/DNA-binding winged helix-turn-helix (wHTH) protein
MKLLYKFGSFYIDTQNKILFQNDKPVQLKPKVFDTLLALVEGKGNVITKNDLMEKIWAETAVEENNLQQNISVLRRVLGEAEDGEKYIETLPKRGYRFAAMVEEIAEDEALIVERRTRSKIVIEQKPQTLADEKVITPVENAVTQSQTAAQILPATQKRKQTRKVTLAAGAMVVLALAAVGTWRYQPKLFQSPKNNRNMVLKQSQIVGIKNDGEVLGVNRGKLSPDSKMVVYSMEGLNSTENIFVKVINSDYVLPITKELNKNWSPIWSADGSEIAFLSDRDGQIGLWKVHHLGGAATLMNHFTPYAPSVEVAKPKLASWSDDGKTIYYEWRFNFFALDMDSKEPVQLTNFDPTKSQAQDFSLSPDKEWIVYTDRKDKQTDIWKVSTKGGTPVQVTNDSIVEKNPVWSADGKSLLYTSSQQGSHELSLFDFASNESSALLSGMEVGDIVDISRDRSKILYRIRKDEVDLWKVNIASGEETRITSDVGVEFWPDVSPDGTTIAFQAVKGSNFQVDPSKCLILTKPLIAESQAVQRASSASQAQWSPDGKMLAFLQSEKGLTNLRVIPVVGGNAVQITEDGVSTSGFDLTPYNHIKDYSWSPDGSKLAYISKKDDLPNLSMASVDGSGEMKLSNNTDAKLYLTNPSWSPDGKRLAYVSDDYLNPQSGKRTFKVWIASLENPANPEMIFQTDSYVKLVGWSADDELIAGLVDKKEISISGTIAIDLYQLNQKANQKLTTLKQAYFLNLHLSPDKKTLAFVAVQDKKANIYAYALKGGETKQISRNTDATIFFTSLAWTSDGAFICYGKQERLNSFTLIDGLK